MYTKNLQNTKYIYLKVHGMATLPLKVEWGDHHAFPSKEGDDPPPMERRIFISFNLKRKVEIYCEHKLCI